MRRYAIVAGAAAAVIGGGVAFGSTQQNSPTPTPSPAPASTIENSLRAECEQNAEQIRRETPEAYVGDCNYGQGTVSTP